MTYKILRNGIDEIHADAVMEYSEGSGGFKEYLSECVNAAKEKSFESIAVTIGRDLSVSEALSATCGLNSDDDVSVSLIFYDDHNTDLSEDIATGIDEYLFEKYENMLCEECAPEADGDFEEPVQEDVPRKLMSKVPFLGKGAKAFRAAEACESAARYDKPDDEEAPSEFAVMGSAPMAAMSCAAPGMSIADRMEHLSDTWQESLLHLIDERGFTDTEVYKKANVDRKLFSKIRSNPAYQPRKITAVALALALELNLDEAKDFLARAGYAFSPSSVFDLIIQYFIENQVYDIYRINTALFEHDQPIIGG